MNLRMMAPFLHSAKALSLVCPRTRLGERGAQLAEHRSELRSKVVYELK
jgi:hypothetical protein